MPRDLSIQTLAVRLKGLRGWRRWLAAFLAGAISVLAIAPFFAWPVLWLTLPALVWLIDGALSERAYDTLAAASVGWWFGFGYFLAGFFWVGEAFLVEAEIFAVLMPLAVILLPAGLALFYAGATAAAAPWWKGRPARVLVLALTLSVAEWLRGHVLTGLPWNVLGYALTYPLPLMQSAGLLGIYGLTLCALLIFALPAVLWSDAASAERSPHTGALVLLVGLLPLAMSATYGQLRIASAPHATVPGILVRIVQPSVPQREKWQPQNQQRIFLDHLELSTTNASGTKDALSGITHVIWPEAAMPFFPLEQPAARVAIGQMLPAGSLLISGALRAEAAPPGAARPRRFFNSLLVFGEGGLLVASYDKIHLVPFGEYLPMQSMLEAMGLQQLTRMRGGFDAGVTPRPLLHVPRFPVATPLICYEAIFPRAIVQGSDRPQVLINLTNDGWFGNTTGPRQHLHQARVRAVEEGLPLLRAANNGISAVVDPYGRILGRLELDVRGVIDTEVPVPLPPPVYARAGDSVFWLLWLVCAAIAAALTRTARPALKSDE
jgi:apolipoprotein N-acyltransferase